MNDKFSVVILTMWRYAPFLDFLKDLVKLEIVDQIILIDNDPTRKPQDAILLNQKINYFTFNKNIYVNPAWNLGVRLSNNKKICILSDDVIFDFKTFYKVNDILNNDSGVLGMCPGLAEFNQPSFTNGNIDIIPWSGQHTFGFGCLMFVYKDWWIDIPEELLVFCGDNWIFDTCMNRGKQNYLITNMFQHTPYAQTTTKIELPPDLMTRELDLYRGLLDQFLIKVRSAV